MRIDCDSLAKITTECHCKLDDEPDTWHYLRKCDSCNYKWHSLHCPHERNMHTTKRCPECHEVLKVYR